MKASSFNFSGPPSLSMEGARAVRRLGAFNDAWLMRGMGIVGGVIAVGWDTWHVVKAAQNNETGLMWAHIASTTLGAVGIILSFKGFPE